jgi:hypothetical protein
MRKKVSVNEDGARVAYVERFNIARFQLFVERVCSVGENPLVMKSFIALRRLDWVVTHMLEYPDLIK